MTVTASKPIESGPGELDYAALGRPIKGPQALTTDWRRFWALTYNIAKTNWKMRFFGSFFGYLWQLIRPLLMFGVLYVFFTVVAQVNKLGPGTPLFLRRQNFDYGAQLLGAIVLFTFFQEATSGAVRCVVDNEVLVRKVEFPRMVIPLSQVLLACFNLAGNLVVFFVFALISGVHPMVSWFELVPIIVLEAILATGAAMLLSTAFVYFRDIQPIWEVALQILFYASPVIIQMTTVQNHLHGFLLHLYMFNPLAVVIQQLKHAVVTNGAYGAAYWAGGSAQLMIPVGFSIAIFVIGLWVFNRAAPRVADYL